MAAIQKTYINERLWNNIAGRIQTTLAVNQAHPHANGSMNFVTDPRGTIADNLSADPRWSQVIEAGRAIGKHFTHLSYALYGILGNASPAYNAYGYFYVDSARHLTHFNNVDTQLTALNPANPSPPEGMTLAQIETQYNAFSNIILNNISQQTPDLRICHGSCHSSCHASRGRR